MNPAPDAPDTHRSVELTRLAQGRYRATNARGGTLDLGMGGESELFSPVELLLVAIAGCSAIDIDPITGKRAEPTRFDVRMGGEKIRDDLGNRLVDLLMELDVAFPDDEGGEAARDVLPRAVRQSHDRLCTVSRTVEAGTPVEVRVV